MTTLFAWFKARVENIAVLLLTAMFLSFILQIFTPYVINEPLGWTLESCLITWLWVVFWGGAFLLRDQDHVKFDIVYLNVSPGIRRILALITAVAILTGFAAALPAAADYIAFMKIERSSILQIRLDYVFSVYLIFAISLIVYYVIRTIQLLRGAEPDATNSSTDAGKIQS